MSTMVTELVVPFSCRRRYANGILLRAARCPKLAVPLRGSKLRGASRREVRATPTQRYYTIGALIYTFFREPTKVLMSSN